MIFLLTGSSGSGKTTIARALQVDRLEVHDSDEDGVPSDADTAWRQCSMERWMREAIRLQGATETCS